MEKGSKAIPKPKIVRQKTYACIIVFNIWYACILFYTFASDGSKATSPTRGKRVFHY